MKIILDPARCTGLGICESMAPDAFEMNDDGSLTIKEQSPSREQLDEVRAAIASCPTEALRLQE